MYVSYWYIDNTTARFQTFVDNRLSEIHEGPDMENWNYVMWMDVNIEWFLYVTIWKWPRNQGRLRWIELMQSL